MSELLLLRELACRESISSQVFLLISNVSASISAWMARHKPLEITRQLPQARHLSSQLSGEVCCLVLVPCHSRLSSDASDLDDVEQKRGASAGRWRQLDVSRSALAAHLCSALCQSGRVAGHYGPTTHPTRCSGSGAYDSFTASLGRNQADVDWVAVWGRTDMAATR